MSSVEVDLRASSVSTLFDCPARWEAIHLEGHRLPTSGAAWLGTSVHHATACFDLGTLEGKPISIDDAAGELVDTLYHPTEDVEWTDTTQRKAEHAGLVLLKRYCEEIAPQQNYTMVEYTLESLSIDMGNGVVINLTGTLDRVRQAVRQALRLHGVLDVKSGARAVDAEGRAATGAHKPQLGVYELLAEQALGIPMDLPGAIAGLKTSGEPAAAVDTIAGCKDALINQYLPAAAMFFREGIFPGNPRSMLCSERYCPIYSTCQWRG